MSSGDTSKELQSLIRKLRDQHADVLAQPAGGGGANSDCPGIDPAEPLLGCFVRSFLIWESTTAKAAQAMKKLETALVDYNELRHCLPDELARIIGERYPRIGERALRLRTALNRIYAREHAVTLEHLPAMGKREAQQYLIALEGVPSFVASRMVLLALGGHAAPVDSRIHRRLIEARVLDEESTVEEAAGSLERKTKAGELPEVYTLLQAWADEGAFPAAESHLDGLRPIIRPAVDKAAREAARREAKKPARLRRPGAGGSTPAPRKKRRA